MVSAPFPPKTGSVRHCATPDALYNSSYLVNYFAYPTRSNHPSFLPAKMASAILAYNHSNRSSMSLDPPASYSSDPRPSRGHSRTASVVSAISAALRKSPSPPRPATPVQSSSNTVTQDHHSDPELFYVRQDRIGESLTSASIVC